MTGAVPRCWAVVPAAGIGTRMGTAIPKQYLEVAGATVLEHSLRALLASGQIVGVVVALGSDDECGRTLSVMRDDRVQVVTGGAQRSDSVLAGLALLAGRAAPGDWVLVHDAARPCLVTADVERLIGCVTATGIGGLLAEPIADTVKQAGPDGLVLCTLDRATLWRAQTPQAFRLDLLCEAVAEATRRELAITDEASAMELAGHPVQLVPGPASNVKITTPGDLELAAFYLTRYRQAATGAASCA